MSVLLRFGRYNKNQIIFQSSRKIFLLPPLFASYTLQQESIKRKKYSTKSNVESVLLSSHRFSWNQLPDEKEGKEITFLNFFFFLIIQCLIGSRKNKILGFYKFHVPSFLCVECLFFSFRAGVISQFLGSCMVTSTDVHFEQESRKIL